MGIEDMLATIATNMGHISVIMSIMLLLNMGAVFYFWRRLRTMEWWLEYIKDNIRNFRR